MSDTDFIDFNGDGKFARSKPIWKPEANKKYLVSPVWYSHLEASLKVGDSSACRTYAEGIHKMEWEGKPIAPRFFACLRYYSDSERNQLRVGREDAEAQAALTKLSKLEISKSEKLQSQNKRPWDLENGSYAVTALVIWDEQSLQTENKKFRTPDSMDEISVLSYTLSMKNYKAFKDHHQRKAMMLQDPEVQITNGDFKKPNFVIPKYEGGNNLVLCLLGKGSFKEFNPPCDRNFLVKIKDVADQIPDISGKLCNAKDIEEIISGLTRTSSGGRSESKKAEDPAAVANADQIISDLLD